MSAERDESARGQTTLDFAVGAGVFLVTLAGVLAGVSAFFDPFIGVQSQTLTVADAGAAQLTEGLLVADGAEPGVLSGPCTVAFFTANDSLASDYDCTASGTTDFASAVGIEEYGAEVVIHEPTDPVTQEATVEIPVEGTTHSVTLRRSNSDTVPTDVSVARRVVSLDGTIYRLTVRVW
ncbi:DUF7287 family protein [Haloparvum sedimenti]|uniref:DUF7287 family protein n=1 Tax=Haloparvum sedimenti TaxID=1678448 RepID=UPI00071E7032|nr:hypothetical protein [Haloparvum sedimenti]